MMQGREWTGPKTRTGPQPPRVAVSEEMDDELMLEATLGSGPLTLAELLTEVPAVPTARLVSALGRVVGRGDVVLLRGPDDEPVYGVKW